ncbi:MAG: methyltransferase domain-containing protein [Candidatus Omnitrophica bacterium]|nr:methyltransferase domain-containing protein [Candidatus Omnitrophota bacterium]
MSRLSNYRESVIGLGYDFIKSRALQVAFELDIFERLRNGSKTALTLSEELKANPDSLKLFLNALASLGLIEIQGSSYQNTKYGSEIFLKEKPLYLGDCIKLHGYSFGDWAKLKEVVLTGKPVDKPDFFKIENPELTTGFARAMHNTAMGHAEYFSKKFSLKGVKTLLDLGGGPGTFTVEFLKENPELRATIFDLPTTLKTTRKFVEAAGFSNRVQFQGGDFNQDEIQGAFDVCFLSHIIHSQTVDKNKKLFSKILSHLNPGGKLVVQDFFLNPDKHSPQFSAIFALVMILHTDGGRTYTFDEVEGWMKEAGFLRCSRLHLKLPRSISLVIGQK